MAKASLSNTLIARLVSVDEKAGERLLGEYAFHHTRTIPGQPDGSNERWRSFRDFIDATQGGE